MFADGRSYSNDLLAREPSSRTCSVLQRGTLPPPTMRSADLYRLRRQTSKNKYLPRTPALCTPQSIWDFVLCGRPAQPITPRPEFVLLGPQLCHRFPSDPASPRAPLPSASGSTLPLSTGTLHPQAFAHSGYTTSSNQSQHNSGGGGV